MVPAPGRFSTTICWPRSSDILSATRRATTSVAPPAGYGTIKRTGLFGYGWLDADEAANTSAKTADDKRRMLRKVSSQCFGRVLGLDRLVLIVTAVAEKKTPPKRGSRIYLGL